jgi:hypothetical protein
MKDRSALVALVAGAVGIGFAPIFVRLADVGYTAAAFWRVALALPVLALLWAPRRGQRGHCGPSFLQRRLSATITSSANCASSPAPKAMLRAVRRSR